MGTGKVAPECKDKKGARLGWLQGKSKCVFRSWVGVSVNSVVHGGEYRQRVPWWKQVPPLCEDTFF